MRNLEVIYTTKKRVLVKQTVYVCFRLLCHKKSVYICIQAFIHIYKTKHFSIISLFSNNWSILCSHNYLDGLVGEFYFSHCNIIKIIDLDIIFFIILQTCFKFLYITLNTKCLHMFYLKMTITKSSWKPKVTNSYSRYRNEISRNTVEVCQQYESQWKLMLYRLNKN